MFYSRPTHRNLVFVRTPVNSPIPHLYLGKSLDVIPTDAGAICLVIAREELMQPGVGSSLDTLLHLSSSEENARRFAGSVLLAFDGYNEDPRPIHAIPECRAYLGALTAQWPFWMHFLAPIPDQWSLLLLTLLPPGQRSALPDGRFGQEFDIEAMEALLTHQVQAMNNLHQMHKLAPKLCHQVFHQAISAVEQVTGIRPISQRQRPRTQP